jgi:hypothetical protein
VSLSPRCPKDNEVVRFEMDWIGRVLEICPVCDEGKAPSTPQHPDLRDDIGYCGADDCGKVFRKKASNQKYCGQECATKARIKRDRVRYQTVYAQDPNYREAMRRYQRERYARLQKYPTTHQSKS